ncbi:MAG TPA: hemin uptake protein HemP [Lacipirellula sp.]
MSEPPTKPTPKSSTSAEPLRISSEDLFRGGRTLLIAHQGEEYRLLITRNNRLILQK